MNISNDTIAAPMQSDCSTVWNAYVFRHWSMASSNVYTGASNGSSYTGSGTYTGSGASMVGTGVDGTDDTVTVGNAYGTVISAVIEGSSVDGATVGVVVIVQAVKVNAHAARNICFFIRHHQFVVFFYIN